MAWSETSLRFMIAHLEDYVFATEGEKVATKYLINERDSERIEILRSSQGCSSCYISVDEAMHVITNFQNMS